MMRKDEKIIAELRWDDVNEIVAFKRDLGTTDRVCFEFHLKSKHDVVYETNEEVKGFQELVKRLESIFPTFDKNWPQKVIKPAFATNRTVIFRAEQGK